MNPIGQSTGVDSSRIWHGQSGRAYEKAQKVGYCVSAQFYVTVCLEGSSALKWLSVSRASTDALGQEVQ
jgi:hypothetical protein